MDKTTTKILDKFVSIIDFIDYNIISVENINKKRKQFKDFHAIYFIDSTKESIDKIIVEDFSEYRQGDADPSLPFADKGGPLY